ncbi:MAG TPA: hypothetical protein ENH59_03370 [Bacteroidetes bacterium]|nr:hypothetical protein [Bacteroidota bacterium]
MEHNRLFSIGTVTKKDSIILNDRIDDRSALVFIAEHPYSGYYGTTVPDKKEPQSMYLVTDQNYDDDRIIRTIQAIKTHFKYDFDAVPGTISFLNKHLGVIRVRCVSYEHVPALLMAFRKEGLEFMSHRKFPPFEGIIRVTKYFKTEEAEKGIFFDLENPFFAYLHIDRHMDWNTFEKIYRDVRNNITEFSFDAALATMYDEKGLIDFIRIYDEKSSLEKLRTVYRKFKDVTGRY